MKRIIGAGVLLIFGWYIVITNAATPVSRNGALKVAGGKIVNSHGIPPELHGLSFSWSIWGGRKYFNPGVVDHLKSDFKVDVIRLPMAVEPDHGYLQEPAQQHQLITSVADEAVKEGIYFLIDWHDDNANLHVEQSKQFFTAMAQRYHSVPNVIYEIWNEPGEVSWPDIKTYAAEVITAIRKYDKHNLIIVGCPHWDEDVDVAAKAPITGFSNIAYSLHFYSSDPHQQDTLRNKATQAIKAGFPLFVSEWGVGESDGDGKFDLKKTDVWLKWMKDNKLSWTNWSIIDNKVTTALLRPGAPVTGNWTSNNLSPSGLFIRKELRAIQKKGMPLQLLPDFNSTITR